VLNYCRIVFGKDKGKVPRQKPENRPGVEQHSAEVIGRNRPGGHAGGTFVAPGKTEGDVSAGPHGVIIIATEYDPDDPADVGRFLETYVHELGNLLDYALDPSKNGYLHGNPNDPSGDTDAGRQFEMCVRKNGGL